MRVEGPHGGPLDPKMSASRKKGGYFTSGQALAQQGLARMHRDVALINQA
jgi:hypothetical protein